MTEQSMEAVAFAHETLVALRSRLRDCTGYVTADEAFDSFYTSMIDEAVLGLQDFLMQNGTAAHREAVVSEEIREIDRMTLAEKEKADG